MDSLSLLISSCWRKMIRGNYRWDISIKYINIFTDKNIIDFSVRFTDGTGSLVSLKYHLIVDILERVLMIWCHIQVPIKTIGVSILLITLTIVSTALDCSL